MKLSKYMKDILNMCMKECGAENYFQRKLQLFKLSHFSSQTLPVTILVLYTQSNQLVSASLSKQLKVCIHFTDMCMKEFDDEP